MLLLVCYCYDGGGGGGRDVTVVFVNVGGGGVEMLLLFCYCYELLAPQALTLVFHTRMRSLVRTPSLSWASAHTISCTTTLTPLQ